MHLKIRMRTIVAVCMLGKHTGFVSDKKNTHTILELGYIMDIFFVKHWHFIDSILYDSIREHIIIVNYITFNDNIFVKTNTLEY